MSRLYKLQLLPKFESIFEEYKERVTPAEKPQKTAAPGGLSFLEMQDAFRQRLRQLIEKAGVIIGQGLTVENDIYIPLKKKGLTNSQVANTFRYLKGEGYIADYANMSDMATLTNKGYLWATEQDAYRDNSGSQVIQSSYSAIPIPKNLEDEKIKTLIDEINRLPSFAEQNYPNLIAHQLRTLLALVLLSWLTTYKKQTLQEKDKSLYNLIQYCLNNAKALDNGPTDKRILGELRELKESKIKDLADDVIHCNYSLADTPLVIAFINQIKHLISLIYGR